MRRLDWEQTLAGEAAPRRLIAALRFYRVLACKSRNIDLAMPEAAMELVGSSFIQALPPAAARCCCSRKAQRCGSMSNASNAS